MPYQPLEMPGEQTVKELPDFSEAYACLPNMYYLKYGTK